MQCSLQPVWDSHCTQPPVQILHYTWDLPGQSRTCTAHGILPTPASSLQPVQGRCCMQCGSQTSWNGYYMWHKSRTGPAWVLHAGESQTVWSRPHNVLELACEGGSPWVQSSPWDHPSTTHLAHRDQMSLIPLLSTSELRHQLQCSCWWHRAQCMLQNPPEILGKYSNS